MIDDDLNCEKKNAKKQYHLFQATYLSKQNHCPKDVNTWLRRPIRLNRGHIEVLSFFGREKIDEKYKSRPKTQDGSVAGRQEMSVWSGFSSISTPPTRTIWLQLPKRVTMRKQTKMFHTAMNILSDLNDVRMFLNWSPVGEDESISKPSSSFLLDSLKFTTAPALARSVAAMIRFDNILCLGNESWFHQDSACRLLCFKSHAGQKPAITVTQDGFKRTILILNVSAH